jgi:hypothetical protein
MGGMKEHETFAEQLRELILEHDPPPETPRE